MLHKILLKLVGRLGIAIIFVCSIAGQTKAIPSSIEFNYLQPATYIIEDIHIIGVTSLEPEVLLAISNLSIGDTIQVPGSAIKNALEKLWQQKIIKDAAIYASPLPGNRIIVSIHIVESPRLSSYVFTGVTKREKKGLIEKINLARGEVISPKLINKIKHIIKKHFLELGYRDIQIEIDSVPDAVDTTYHKLKINISKGEKFIINKIVLKGNDHISSDKLKAYLQLREKPRFTLIRDMLYKICTLQPIRKGGICWRQPSLERTIVYLKKHVIFSSSKFIQEQYKKDKDRLLQYYQNQGYKDIAIVKDTVYKSGEGLLNVELELEEGEQYYIRNIKWVGNYIYPTYALNKILNIRPGAIYNPGLLHERLVFSPHGKDISSLYMDDGYFFFHIEPVEVAVVGNQVDLELRIREGSQATVNNIYIQGNNYTHEDIIRRELKILPGDKFNRSKVIRSQRELAMLNIFDPNKIEIRPLPDIASDSVDILFKVKEALRFNVQVSASIESGPRFTFAIDLGTNNFSLKNALHRRLPIGDLQNFHIKAELHGKNHQELTLQFMDPWLTGKTPTSFDLAFNAALYQHDKSTTSEDHHKGSAGSFSIKTGIGKRLTWPDDYCVFKTGFRYQVCAYDREKILGRLFSGVSHEILLNVSLERNALDQPTYPTAGSLIGLHAKLTPPYSLFSKYPITELEERLKKKEYFQAILDIGYFYNIWEEWVINLFANGGILGSYSPQQEIGPFERFSMGELQMSKFSLLGKEIISLRGYPGKYITPVDKKTGYEGGVLFDKVGIELRHPIVKSSMLFVYGLAFAEAGNTWVQYTDWKLFDLKRSVGVGLRFYFPLGLLGLDWGYGFDKKGADKLSFHWSWGSSVR